jgi:hypothetical protein
MNEFTKAEAMSAISIVGLAKLNAEGYCKDAGDIAVSAIVALKMAVEFAEHGIPPDVVSSLTYREPEIL